MSASSRNKTLALNLAALAAGMAMLSFASVPLYRLFCAMTGYGGATVTAVAAPGAVAGSPITVRFNADTSPELPWDFQPGEKQLALAVGEERLTFYRVRNRSARPVTGRATYNVLPFAAGPYFNKIECFCFREQRLEAGQEVEMPVSFFIDPAIRDDPQLKHLKTITLSYTFFPVKAESD